MTQLQKRAWATLLIWGAAGLVFFTMFFMGAAASDYVGSGSRFIVSNAAIAAAYILYFLAMFMTRAEAGSSNVSDERDVQTQFKAIQASFIVFLVYAYVLALILWELYRDSEMLPIAYMWFFAYSLVILAFVVSSGATLFMDRRSLANA